MKFIRIASIAEGTAPLSDRLITELKAGKQVVWVLTGGSNIQLCAAVMEKIPENLTELLTVFLTDERYGPVGHPDSNERQLEEAGFVPKRAHWIKVLQDDDTTMEDTAKRYAEQISAACAVADVVIAVVGMGPDGHVCGILPASPAVNSDKLVMGYASDPYQRITLTPKALRQFVDTAYVFAFGEGKRQALENLRKDLPLDEQPAQVLKQLPEAYVYNDLIEGEV